MDQTAFTLCRENNLPIIVFDMNTQEIFSPGSGAKKLGRSSGNRYF
jgi:uridylate kinase